MSEMIETVARAIGAAFVAQREDDVCVYTDEKEFPEMGIDGRANLLKIARAAIEAYEKAKCASAFHDFLDISLAKAAKSEIGQNPTEHDLGFAKGVEMTIATAANRVRELEDALEPFAEAASHPINIGEDGDLPDLALNGVPFTMYTIRRARNVLEGTKG
jgi:hypothetical protein